MGMISNGKVTIIGNFAKVTKKKPKDWMKDYKVMVPYFFNWREKIGKVTCDCTECLECYQPYYGRTWYHSDDCALMKQVKARPSLLNLWPYQSLPLIAHDE